MDQIDGILRLKNCFRELEEIDKDQVHSDLNRTKTEIAKKIYGIVQTLDLSDFIPQIRRQMTNNELIDTLIKHAKEYVPSAIESVNRNKHMNNLDREHTAITRDIVNALITDFINFIGTKYCMDVGLYAKDLIKSLEPENPETY